MAASMGDLAAMKFLFYKRNCPFDARALEAAENNGDAQMVDWIIDNLESDAMSD